MWIKSELVLRHPAHTTSSFLRAHTSCSSAYSVLRLHSHRLMKFLWHLVMLLSTSGNFSAVRDGIVSGFNIDSVATSADPRPSATLAGGKLHIDGYVYFHSREYKENYTGTVGMYVLKSARHKLSPRYLGRTSRSYWKAQLNHFTSMRRINKNAPRKL